MKTHVGAISVVDTASEVESARVAFFDPSPNAIKIGRKHLYDTHKNSGLGQIACGSCHVDAKMDRLAWDLGNPAGAMKAVAGQNLGAGVPGLNIGFQDFHPMKGPMTTQTLQDIIGKEPLHWRGDRNGLEEFAPAFQGLQGDDTTLTPAEMQQFEDFLATISFTPNPYRNFDNTLPTSVDLAGHYTTGRFAAAGLPLGLNNQGNAQAGLTAYTTLLLDTGALRCVTCHTLPTGMGTDYTLQGAQLVPIPAGPNGEHHHMLVSRDGETNVSMKVPQTRNIFRKVGFNATQMINRTGFGYIHDGSVDSIERFVSEPVFTVTSDQQVADLTAFMLSFSGSDLPQGSPTNFLEPPGGTSNDTHAAVGTQTTIVDPATSSPAQFVLIANMLTIADTGKVGLIVKGRQGGLARGYAYAGSGLFRSDRAAETISWSALELAAAPGSELTWTVVPKGTEIRSGIDRDLDGAYDQDELDAGSNPADPLSLPAPAGFAFCAGDGLDPLVTTACPCNNFGASGRGCANSANASGALLSASGVASLDTIVMHAAGMPATATAIYLQGDVDTASGIVFGDGVRCVSGALIRLGIEASNAGASQYPGLGDASIRLRSAALGDPLSNGSTRYYQTYYRDGVPSFCPSPLGNSWNVTNGVRIAW